LLKLLIAVTSRCVFSLQLLTRYATRQNNISSGKEQLKNMNNIFDSIAENLL